MQRVAHFFRRTAVDNSQQTTNLFANWVFLAVNDDDPSVRALLRQPVAVYSLEVANVELMHHAALRACVDQL